MIPTQMLSDEGGYPGLYSRFTIFPFRPSGSSVVLVMLIIDMIPDYIGAHLHVQKIVERSNQIS